MSDHDAQRTFVDSADLFNACGSADTAVQAAAYRELWTYLYRVAWHMTSRQPDQEALAQDCAQRALVRIHQQRLRCQEPKAFHAWSRRIVSNLVIDELRRRQRLQPLPDSESKRLPPLSPTANPESKTLGRLTAVALRQLLNQAPISDRSRRVVIGRYLDDHDDEQLAQIESELAGEAVLPSHVQVTRSKNIGKLRQWPLLRQFLQEAA